LQPVRAMSFPQVSGVMLNEFPVLITQWVRARFPPHKRAVQFVARSATGVTADRQVRPTKDGGAALPRRRDFGRVTSAAMFAALRGLGADEVNQPPAQHAESEFGAPPCALAQSSVWMSPIGIPAGGGVLICR
jgi:hypothetical protein